MAILLRALRDPLHRPRQPSCSCSIFLTVGARASADLSDFTIHDSADADPATSPGSRIASLWRRVLWRMHRVLFKRRLWGHLGNYLKQFSALRLPGS